MVFNIKISQLELKRGDIMGNLSMEEYVILCVLFKKWNTSRMRESFSVELYKIFSF